MRSTGSTGRHKICGGHIECSGALSNHFNSCQSSLAPAAAAFAAAVDRGGNWWFDCRQLPATCRMPHAFREPAWGAKGVGTLQAKTIKPPISNALAINQTKLNVFCLSLPPNVQRLTRRRGTVISGNFCPPGIPLLCGVYSNSLVFCQGKYSIY